MDVSGQMSVSGSRGVVARENSCEVDDTIRVGFLYPTKERCILFPRLAVYLVNYESKRSGRTMFPGSSVPSPFAGRLGL